MFSIKAKSILIVQRQQVDNVNLCDKGCFEITQLPIMYLALKIKSLL
jgi:hypothetical protein